jgi:flavin reductase (DIM6/NTAB) family NADH-FMN oxidoreductase RutF
MRGGGGYHRPCIVIVTSHHGGRPNIMSAAWSVPLDFDPPKVAVVIDKSTYTRRPGAGRSRRGCIRTRGAWSLSVLRTAA